MEFYDRRFFMSLLLLVLVHITVFIDAYSHHIRHYRDRFKRQQGANLFLPGSYVTDNNDPEGGPWGNWSAPGGCTRTCGGGVSTQFRSCTPGYVCTGPTKIFFSCNTQDCDDNSDFRSQQCSAYDNIPFEGITYQWVPYTKGPNPCELNCMPKGERFYYRQKLHVEDGTRCNDENLDVCVEGQCQPVGCDMMLGSNAREDKCRVCEGNNENCNTITGLLDMQDLQVGYNDILLIPAGATNIVVKERGPSNNYLAVRDVNFHYHLNGNWRIDFPRTLDFAGCKFHYDRYAHGFAAPDSVTCVGPTNEALFIVLLYQETNVGVEYEYSVPENIVPSSKNETYAWTFDQFTPCTSSCGGGIHYRNVSCAGRRTLEPVDPTLCDAANRPIEAERCGEVPCDARWITKPWDKCSAPCGVGGSQTRQIQCERVIANGVASIVDDEQCNNIQKPNAEQPCNQGAICAEWHTTPWKPCDHLCGDGLQTRTVTCFRKVNGKVEKLDDEQCAEAKPDVEKACNLRPCEGVDWVTSDWSGCDKCGLNSESRKVQCATAKGQVYPDELCEGEQKPETERTCDTDTAGCDYEWYASQWSECSSKCGKGVKTRKVFCASIDDLQKTDDGKCDAAKKYEASAECQGEQEVCTGEWFSGPWSKCTKDCGGGEQTRKTICMRDEVTVAATDCDPDSIPSSLEACNKRPCEKDEVIPVDVTKPVDVTDITEQPEKSTESGVTIDSDVELLKPESGDDEEYEIVDDDECEDGEWVYVDEEEKQDLKLITLTKATNGLFGASTEFGLTESSRESSPNLEDMMMSDSTGTDEETRSTIAVTFDTGSGDGELTSKVEGKSTPEIVTDDEGSGEGESTIIFEEITTDVVTKMGETVGSEATEVPGDEVTQTSSESGTTGVTDAVTESSSDVSDITGTTISGETTGGDVTGTTSDITGTTEVDITGTTEVGVTGTTAVAVSETTEVDVTKTTEVGVTEATEVDVTKTTEGGVTKTTEVGVTETTEIGVTETTEVGGTTSSDITESVTEDGIESSSDVTATTEAVTTDQTTTDITTTLISDTTEATESTTGVQSTTDSPTTVDTTVNTVAILTTTEESTYILEPPDDFGEIDIVEETRTEVPETTTEVSETTTEASGTTTEVPETTTEVSGTTTDVSETTTEVSQTTTEVSENTSEQTSTTEVAEGTSEQSLTTESTEIALESTTELTGTTSTEITESVASSEGYTGSTELSTEVTESKTEYTGSTEATESTTEYTGTTESETSHTESTEAAASTTEYTGFTESTTEYTGSTESTIVFTASTEFDIWSSTTEATSGTTEWVDIFKKPKKCKRKKRKGCKESPFGCCFDKITPAQGPFNKGCPMPKTCKESTFGCCEDGVSPARGKNFKGCPATHCEESLFGCCWDGKTPAEGEFDAGCPAPPPACLKSMFGCCDDNVTEATGPDSEGCEEIEEPEDCANSTYGCCPDGQTSAKGEYFRGCDIKKDCKESQFGCCPDQETAAEGPNYRGCETPCANSPYGCCEDGITPAHGYNREGCCLSAQHGCCPDNIKAAEGPNLEGCGCEYSPYKCCPDNVTAARGYNNEGCGCQYTEHGCCPDLYTPAAGPNYEGCLCHTYQFGCCPDGVTFAIGPHQQGCGCRNTEFGCCSDETTPATGPNEEGCGCASTKYGCCPDGIVEALDENFKGCVDIPPDHQAGCSAPKERGPCRNYTVRWYFDMEYGGCSRFWYGGCDGNDNRFTYKEDCEKTCIEPEGKDRCKLPQIRGPCEGFYPKWYYEREHNRCSQFHYGGCLGNNNRFETGEDCIKECVVDTTSDACDQPRQEGPCRGQYLKWFYNQNTSRCEQFYYGGCKANSNNFPTEDACNQQCSAPNRKKEHCSLPRAQGNCTSREPRWYYDASEKRCMPFYFSGCDGNKNNYFSLEQCQQDCPQEIPKDTCHLPAETGECADYKERWYYDTKEKACRLFYYGGCGGNGNNFASESDCLGRCEHAPAPAPEPEPKVPETTVPTTSFKIEDCFLPSEAGPCRENATARWFYDRDGACKQFMYGGCEGNNNNFNTAEECDNNCGNAQDTCSLPMVVGPCGAEYDSYFYDQETDTCKPFKFGGCYGNNNRFEDIASCEQRCRRGPRESVTEPSAPQAPEPETSDTAICFHNVDPGNCNESHAAYYYDAAARKCSVFTYTGCGGNANRYISEEQCERQCGLFRGQDVCRFPKETGPCRGYFIKYYYDIETGTCRDFVFGGCDGTGNRFSSVAECESICVIREESRPALTNNEICRLPMDVGVCDDQGSHKRWYFDDARGECTAFIYSGCAGNFNRFKSFQECVNTCGDLMVPLTNNEIDSDLGPEVPVDGCAEHKEECQTVQCPYGKRGYVDDNLCNRCSCYNPCDGYDCPESTRCAIDINNNRTSDNDETFIPVCREVNKPGECPQLQEEREQCNEECRDDSDCTVDLKCCRLGCSAVCVAPHSEVPPAELVTQGYLPAYTEPPLLAGYHPLEVDTEVWEPEVTAREGDVARLNCAVKGNPNPRITWNKGNLVIDGTQPRYRLLLDGTLQIITVHKTDSGVYLCKADNSIGKSLTNEIRLTVEDGVDFPTNVFEVPEAQKVMVSLGSPASLQCYVLGYPFPAVTWWRNDIMVPLKTNQFEQHKDYSLLIHRVELADLGMYTCQAYNGVGQATSWTVSVWAQGPVYTNNPDEARYMNFVEQEGPPRVEPTKGPSYPYRPQRPQPSPTNPPPPPPPPEIDTPVEQPETNNVEEPERPNNLGREYAVPVTVNITLTESSFGVGSNVSIPCNVDGFPVPVVQWYREDEALYNSDHYSISDSNRLTIIAAGETDSGLYKCTARNDRYFEEDRVIIKIEGVYVDPSCTDNPFFANCGLIVSGRYCNHDYYRRFCCRSCTLAGQLADHRRARHSAIQNLV